MQSPKRSEPKYKRNEDYRSPYERDYDRLLYSSAFNRLSGVTQVVNPGEGLIFHNRLTHSIKVAQIGTRLAEFIIKKYPHESPKIEYYGGLDPVVVSTASLAHDLGTPPFGHIAEKRLNEIMLERFEDPDGFEGNAQSFRIVTKLSAAYLVHSGLNLTCASLNAILKYPWFAGENPKKESKKYGVYSSEREDFNWARSAFPYLNKTKTLEAALMDLADDMIYAIHDLEDFYRANILPFGVMFNEITEDEVVEILEKTNENWFRKDGIDLNEIAKKVTRGALDYFKINKPYEGTRDDYNYLHTITSTYLTQFIEGVQLSEDIEKDKTPIFLDPISAAILIVLKEKFKYYMIGRPALLRQQLGEVKIIDDLFEILFEASCSSSQWRKIIPPLNGREVLEILDNKDQKDDLIARARIIVDVISGLSDQEAIRLHGRLTGSSPGSIFDFIM
jgi:dGTPase